MHISAYETARKFFHTYTSNKSGLSVLEIGSKNYNGTLRDFANNNVSQYIGIDTVPGLGVDKLVEDFYKLPYQDNSFDVCVSSSHLGHNEMFWVTFLEALRVLKPNGLLYLNSASAWMFYHRLPVDCWRFYPDAAKGLEKWGRHNNYNVMTLETFIVPPGPEMDTCDWAAVFLKHFNYQEQYPNRIIDNLKPYDDYFNGFRFPKTLKFPHGWDFPVAPYHMATKKTNLLPYDGLKY
jgi:SAM-dependent methyltransferase